MTAIHPQIQAIADRRVLAAGDEEPGPPELEALRAGYLQAALELGGALEPVADVADVVFPRADGGRVPARVYRPLAPGPQGGLLVWCHGGGWVMGDLEGFDRVARQLANACGVPCVSVDYRLAPEHPFPAAVDDAQAAIEWACGDGAEQLGSDPARVVVGGDSAGAQLVTLALSRSRARRARAAAGLPGARRDLRQRCLSHLRRRPGADARRHARLLGGLPRRPRCR